MTCEASSTFVLHLHDHVIFIIACVATRKGMALEFRRRSLNTAIRSSTPSCDKSWPTRTRPQRTSYAAKTLLPAATINTTPPSTDHA